MNKHGKINYIELPSNDLNETKKFYSEVFEWKFTDYGSEYIAFFNEGLDGGFYKSDKVSNTEKQGGALVVFYSKDLKETKEKIIKANGKIVKDIFKFPGGSRFHFNDTSGNELAVWSE